MAVSVFTVYQLFDASGKLIYVGMTNNGLRRLAEHRMDQTWWSSVSHARFEHYQTHREAAERERFLLATRLPLENQINYLREGQETDRTDKPVDRLLTVRQAAYCLRLSEAHVRRFIREGRLPAVAFGGQKTGYRVLESDLAAFIAAHRRTEGQAAPTEQASA